MRHEKEWGRAENAARNDEKLCDGLENNLSTSSPSSRKIARAVDYDKRRDDHMRGIWRNRLLPPSTRLIGVILATYLNGRSFRAWPSIGTLMSETGMSRPTVKRALQQLAEAGHYRIIRYGKGRSSSLYAPIERGMRGVTGEPSEGSLVNPNLLKGLSEKRKMVAKKKGKKNLRVEASLGAAVERGPPQPSNGGGARARSNGAVSSKGGVGGYPQAVNGARGIAP